MGKRVILTYNLIREEDLYHKPVDTMAELDTPETVAAVKAALEQGGHEVIPVEADENAFARLRDLKKAADIVFNLAEGLRGESRESHIPCMLEMLGIPYVGSGPLTLALCLNKYRTKEILRLHGIPTPRYRVFKRFSPAAAESNAGLNFPVILKLSSEGSCVGIDYDSVVDNEKDFIKKLEYLFTAYDSTVLAEEYLPGREFTIPVIGNDPPETLPIIEIMFFGEKPINVFFPDMYLDVFKVLTYTPPEQKTKSVCPAEIGEGLAKDLRRLALKAYDTLECRDWCRMEIRLDAEGNPQVLELNPIPGIAPGFWFPRSAEAAGMDYASFINGVLDRALLRYGRH